MRVLIQAGSGAGPGRSEGAASLWAVGQRISLDENEVHHLRVRRAKDRENVEILDGAGLSGTGRLIQSGRQWLVEIRTIERQVRPPETTLAVAAGDRERFSWMVEKSVELGVTSIVPLETARSAGVATRLKEVHLRRLRRSALEATKQCGAAWAPTVEDPVTLTEFVRRPVPGAAWLADPEGTPAPTALDHAPLAVVVGPEGGLTDGERTALLTAGYRPVALGFHTLRFETAALAAAAAAAQARMRGQHG
jgi:16S rRNA (uracil1498-N3)-methyltransferase